MIEKKNQVKSKKRVAEHGEVFTAEREVNAMLDHVKQETERIDSRFLEPACGDGNFLVEILNRKLNVVVSKYKKSQFEFERYIIVALSSIYGVDILEDNVISCRQRLFDIASTTYTKTFKDKCKVECSNTLKHILSKNIVWGDALTLKRVDGSDEPIIFTEWTPINGSKIKRRDYTMANLLESQPLDEPNLFSDLGDKAFIPTPVKDYPLTHYLKLADNV